MTKQPNAHISLHVTKSNPRGTLVVQPRNADGTFRRPVAAGEAYGSSFHAADYTTSTLAVITRGGLRTSR